MLYCNTVTIAATRRAGAGQVRRRAQGAGVGAGACAGRADRQASVLGRAGRACWGAQGEHAGPR